MAKYIISGAETRRTRMIWFTTFRPWEAKRIIIVKRRARRERGAMYFMKLRL